MLARCARRAELALRVHEALRTSTIPRDLDAAVRALLTQEMRAWTVDFDWWGRDGRCCAWSAVSRRTPAALDVASLSELERRVKDMTGAGRRRHHRHKRHRRHHTHRHRQTGPSAADVRDSVSECRRTANDLQESWERLKRYAGESAGLDLDRCMHRGKCSSIASRVAQLAAVSVGHAVLASMPSRECCERCLRGLILQDWFGGCCFSRQGRVQQGVVKADGGSVVACVGKHYLVQTSPVGGAETHRTGLAARVQRASVQDVTAPCLTRSTDGHHLCVCGGVAGGHDAVGSLCNDLASAVVHHHGPERSSLAGSGQLDGSLHFWPVFLPM